MEGRKGTRGRGKGGGYSLRREGFKKRGKDIKKAGKKQGGTL